VPLRERGDFADLMGRAAGMHVPASLYYLSREQSPRHESSGFFCCGRIIDFLFKEHHVALHVHV
jgi:hypothetical protein